MSEFLCETCAWIGVAASLWFSVGLLVQGGSRWWLIADPICTFFFAFLVLCTTMGILREIGDILMERVPRGLDADIIQADLRKVTQPSHESLPAYLHGSSEDVSSSFGGRITCLLCMMEQGAPHRGELVTETKRLQFRHPWTPFGGGQALTACLVWLCRLRGW